MAADLNKYLEQANNQSTSVDDAIKRPLDDDEEDEGMNKYARTTEMVTSAV